MRKHLAALTFAFCLLAPGAARAQSTPNWAYGYVPTPAQWAAVFAGKQDYLGAPPLLVTGGVMTGKLITAASTATQAGFNLPPGTAPTPPVNGDLWVTSANIFAQINGATVALGTFGMITPTRAGDVIYWTGSAWTTLAGNNSGTNCFSEGPTGTPAWGACSGGSGTPGGSNTQLQYNNSSSFGGISGATTNGTAVTVANGDLLLSGSSSGNSTLEAPATGGGVVTFPAGAVTLASIGGSQTFSGTNIFSGGITFSNTVSVSNTETVSGTLNVSGTFQASGNPITFPGASATMAALNIADQTVTGGANVTTQSQSAGNITVDCGSRALQTITNSGIFTITAPANDGNCALEVVNGASAGAVSFSSFSGNASYEGATMDTTNGHAWIIFIARANGHALYNIIPEQ